MNKIMEKIKFTKRELAILKLMAEGLTNREIAKNLYFSYNTIKADIANIFFKSKARNRVHAVYILTLNGYIN